MKRSFEPRPKGSHKRVALTSTDLSVAGCQCTQDLHIKREGLLLATVQDGAVIVEEPTKWDGSSLAIYNMVISSTGAFFACHRDGGWILHTGTTQSAFNKGDGKLTVRGPLIATRESTLLRLWSLAKPLRKGAPAAATADDANARLHQPLLSKCVWGHTPVTVLKPCGHRVWCLWCWERVVRNYGEEEIKCSKCNTVVAGIVQLRPTV